MNADLTRQTNSSLKSPAIPASLSDLIDKLEELQPTKPSQVVNILKELDITEEDLLPFADFNHSPEDSYGRKMVYKGANFEVMVMSWNKGDFSAIHDHGFTQWGAVKIFGRAEHATFRWEDENLSTLARWQVDKGDILGVGHSLIHQMGNRTEDPYLTLHVYGHLRPLENITGESRIFDPRRQIIQRVNGGAFFNVPDEKVVRIEDGPRGDFSTLLRFNLEVFKRKLKSQDPSAEDFYQSAFSKSNADQLSRTLDDLIDPECGQHKNSVQWKILNMELKEAAIVQSEHEAKTGTDDRFHSYAEVYDEVIGHTCLDSFMEEYVDFFVKKYGYDFAKKETIAIGCGTGLVEERIMGKYNCTRENIYGIDISESMVSEAQKRIHADVGDVLTLDPEIKKWDLAFSGLNVYQYLPYQQLEEAIQKTADILHDDGLFLGDFITPDHIRWYPNVMFGPDKKVISLRTPRLTEENGASLQESEITNVHFLDDRMDVHYAGKHKRFLAPMLRVRGYFEKYFKGGVDLYDAISLQPLNAYADSCTSTRYIVVARK